MCSLGRFGLTLFMDSVQEQGEGDRRANDWMLPSRRPAGQGGSGADEVYLVAHGKVSSCHPQASPKIALLAYKHLLSYYIG